MKIFASEKRFQNSHARVQRAISHWGEFARQYNQYTAGEPFKAEVRNSDLSGIGEYTITRVIPFPVNIPPIIGDIVHNLRIALDYLAVDLAKENSTTDEKLLKATYFPISPDTSSFNKDGRKKIRSISPAAQVEIEKLQPFQDHMEHLYTLHILDLLDKHNSIIPVGAASVSFGAQFSMEMNPNETYNGVVKLGGTYETTPVKFPIAIGDVVGRIHSKTADSTTASGNVEFQVVFHDTGHADGINVPTMLEHLIQLTNYTIETIDRNTVV